MKPGLMIQLAWHDYRTESRLSLCAVLALVAVLAPLLVLFGLKFGLVTTLTERLEQNPAVREIIPLAGGRFSAGDIDVLAARQDVAFALPRTRQIAATADLYPNGDGQPLTVEMLPTAQGDPLVAPALLPEAADEVTLSRRAAEKLGLRAGDGFTAAFGRQRDGRQEYQRIRLRVKGVLPLEAFPRDGLLSRPGLLEAAEDYRDGKPWPGFRATPDPARVYPGFRLYARDLDSVEGLRQLFADRGLEVATQAAAIAQVRSLSRNLALVFWIIASLAVLGAFAAMTASTLAAVERKRRALAVLRLLGFSTAALIAFVVLQSLYTGLLGVLLASGLYGVAQMGLNRLFETGAGEYACRLLPGHYLAALLTTLSCCVLASASGGWRAARIEASEGLRDV